MKWIPIDKARKLKIDEPVFVKNTIGCVYWGKLVKEEKTVKGIERTFELAVFTTDQPPLSNPFLVTNITHVAIP